MPETPESGRRPLNTDELNYFHANLAGYLNAAPVQAENRARPVQDFRQEWDAVSNWETVSLRRASEENRNQANAYNLTREGLYVGYGGRDYQDYETFTIKEQYIDKETYDTIKNFADTAITIQAEVLIKFLKNKLDILEKKAYSELWSSSPVTTVGILEAKLNSGITQLSRFLDGTVITTAEWIFKEIEKQAKTLYDINHSKYKYYPRLKASIKYGNPELLAKILTVTQLGKGKVICK